MTGYSSLLLASSRCAKQSHKIIKTAADANNSVRTQEPHYLDVGSLSASISTICFYKLFITFTPVSNVQYLDWVSSHMSFCTYTKSHAMSCIFQEHSSLTAVSMQLLKKSCKCFWYFCYVLFTFWVLLRRAPCLRQGGWSQRYSTLVSLNASLNYVVMIGVATHGKR